MADRQQAGAHQKTHTRGGVLRFSALVKVSNASSASPTINSASVWENLRVSIITPA